MKTLIISVSLFEFIEISDKCFKAKAFNGSEALIPKSQFFGEDLNGRYWISEWLLKNTELQYSKKRMALFDSINNKIVPIVYIEKHIPIKIDNIKTIADESLIR